jgi:hypothetical protein
VLFTTAYARNAIVHEGRLDPATDCPRITPQRRRRLPSRRCSASTPQIGSLPRPALKSATVGLICFLEANAIRKGINMAARSFSVTVENSTGKLWTRSALSLPHGEWSNGGALVPPETLPKAGFNSEGDIQPGTIFFEAESQGFATGCEGFVNYRCDLGEIQIHFDNPFTGSNTFSAVGPPNIRLPSGDPSGNDANVTLEIHKAT